MALVHMDNVMPDENKMVGWLDIHPIITIPLWESAPTFNRYKRTVDLSNYLLNDLRELADLLMV